MSLTPNRDPQNAFFEGVGSNSSMPNFLLPEWLLFSTSFFFFYSYFWIKKQKSQCLPENWFLGRWFHATVSNKKVQIATPVQELPKLHQGQIGSIRRFETIFGVLRILKCLGSRVTLTFIKAWLGNFSKTSSAGSPGFPFTSPENQTRQYHIDCRIWLWPVFPHDANVSWRKVILKKFEILRKFHWIC